MKNILLDFYGNTVDENEGSFISGVGYDSEGRECAWRYECNRDNCKCVGHWINGNERDVVEWEY